MFRYRSKQDGATAHTSRVSMSVLRERFPERLISIRGDLEWPARSPDLSPCDFFFVGIFKSTCLRQPPTKPRELKGQHPRRNCQYTQWYASPGHGKHQKPVHEVYRQWGTSPTWYDFQNCVKQNFKYVLLLWNKIKTFLIYTFCFIALWKKEVMLPHPVVFIFLFGVPPIEGNENP